jgi:uncharacterized protein
MKDYWHLHHKRREERRLYALAGTLIVIAFFCGVLIGGEFGGKEAAVRQDSPVSVTGMVTLPIVSSGSLEKGDASYATVRIPAIDEDENGITTVMSVQAFPGSGRILTNIDELLFWTDTQNSIRRATQVAENETGINLSSYDLVYTIEANASVIGGPSAGAAITMATIAALTNRTINSSVMITGSVNHDGTIGPVGAILGKAVAAKEAGASIFLVPMTQASEVTYNTREYCEKIGWVDFCTTETYPDKVDVEEESGMKVIEVMDIEEAMKYMLY